jgi:hypothetical protein
VLNQQTAALPDKKALKMKQKSQNLNNKLKIKAKLINQKH